MRISRITIKNYKSIPASGIEILFRERFIALVGKNNAGKSNILESLGILFGTKNPRYFGFEPTAFNDPTRPIEIEVEIEGLDFATGKSLGLSDPQCHALTKPDKKGEKVPGNITLRLHVPPEAAGAASTGEEPGASGEHESEEEEKQTFSVLLANHSEVKRNEDFRKALVHYLLVPPIRSYSDLLSPSTWTEYGRFLRDVIGDSSEGEALKTLIEETTLKLRGILKAEASAITKTARTTAYVDSIDFRLTREGNPTELLRNLSLVVTYAGRSEDISASGTGTQSAVIIGMLELCLRHRSRRGLRLFLVEEPELFLHPHAQRHVAALLRTIANEGSSHVILTTHSPSVLADTDLLDVVRIDRDTSQATRCSRVPKDFTGLQKAERLLSTHTCEMLFADKVVLVEGPSEVELIPPLAVIVSDPSGHGTCNFDRLNMSLINVGGKTHFLPYIDLLDHLNIEWRIVADLDALQGDGFVTLKKRLVIDPAAKVENQILSLKEHGVFILANGEIEDYYPHDALASIANCPLEEVTKRIEDHRIVLDQPTAIEVVSEIVSTNADKISQEESARLPKLVPVWYSQAIEKLRSASGAQNRRKTGEAVESWLKKSKPAIAQEVARWVVMKRCVPKPLEDLIQWISAR